MYDFKIRKGSNGTVFNSKTAWGVVCSGFPFKVIGDAKDFQSNDFYDQDGTDTYFPSSIKLKAYDIDVEFCVKGYEYDSRSIDNTPRKRITEFLNYLCGRPYQYHTAQSQNTWINVSTGDGTELCIYDEFTRTGKQKVHFVKISDDVFVKHDVSTNGSNSYKEEICTFKVTFRVTDPTTNITL